MRKAKGESCEIQAFNIMGNTLAYLNPVVAICAHCEATVAYSLIYFSATLNNIQSIPPSLPV